MDKALASYPIEVQNDSGPSCSREPCPHGLEETKASQCRVVVAAAAPASVCPDHAGQVQRSRRILAPLSRPTKKKTAAVWKSPSCHWHMQSISRTAPGVHHVPDQSAHC